MSIVNASRSLCTMYTGGIFVPSTVESAMVTVN